MSGIPIISQLLMNIGYLGPKGTFTHHALEQTLKLNLHGFTPIEKLSFDQLFTGLDSNELDTIFVPIENSIEGAVNRVIDYITHTPSVYIIDSFTMPIEQSLLGYQSINLNDIKHIISMPHAIAQCQSFINIHCQNAIIHHSSSTAGAVSMIDSIKLSNEHTVIIGHKGITSYFPLQIIESNIHDQKENSTEFYLLQHKQNQSFDSMEDLWCTLAFSTKKDSPGSLLTVLKIFENHNINLSKILSRPEKLDIGSYIFFVEFKIDTTLEKTTSILTDVKQNTLFFKNLGYYKKQKLHD